MMFRKVLFLSAALSCGLAQAQFNVMTNSIIADSPSQAHLSQLTSTREKSTNDLTDGFVKLNTVKRNRCDLISKAAEMAAASYNPIELVKIKSTPTRQYNDDSIREALINKGHEIISFSATIKKNGLLGDRLAHGQLPAGLISYSLENGKPTIRVAFHGTENNRDLLTDANFFKKSDTSILKNGSMHGGFYNRYMESRDAMMDAIQAVLDAHNLKADQADFVVTGHSLGGALASIAAVDLKKSLASKAKLDLVTFSSPRVFNESAADEAMTILGGRAIRLWRDKDIIPGMLFGTLGYKHIGESIKLDSVIDKLSLANHSMELILNDAVSPQSVPFKADHEGFWTKAKKSLKAKGQAVKDAFRAVASKLNPKNWW